MNLPGLLGCMRRSVCNVERPAANREIIGRTNFCFAAIVCAKE